MIEELLKTGADIYRYLIEKGGLEPKFYDKQFVRDLCVYLGLHKDCDLERKLKIISPEKFMEAFFKAIEPYTRMMNDLCIFFYEHGIKRTNQSMKILFDFGKGIEDLEFDLKHFREILWKYKHVKSKMTIYGLNIRDLWNLAEIFREWWFTNKIQNKKVEQWLISYDKGVFDDPEPIYTELLSQTPDELIRKSIKVWVDIVEAIRKISLKRSDLKKYILQDIEKERKEVLPEAYKVLELPEFEDWAPRNLAYLDSDQWPYTFLKGITAFIENCLLNKDCYLETIENFKQFFSRVPHIHMETEDLVREFLEILNLPIWKRRHELYQVWVLTQVDKALEDYERTVHHVNGNLIFRFSGTHIASFETTNGRLHLWSELRSPLKKPVGKSRKKGIQPDYRIAYEPISEPTKTLVAIECKQYKYPSMKNFSEAIIDYANGCPNAQIILVNYGEIPQKIYENIPSNMHSRIKVIGNFRPVRKEELEEFSDTIKEITPPPLSKKHEIVEDFFDLIAVDVSGSMDDNFSQDYVKNLIRIIVETSPNAKLLAIDTDIKKQWDFTNAKDRLEELFELCKNGSTNIPNALRDQNITKAVVITDEDGAHQLINSGIMPYLLIVILSEEKWDEKLNDIFNLHLTVGYREEKHVYFIFKE